MTSVTAAMLERGLEELYALEIASESLLRELSAKVSDEELNRSLISHAEVTAQQRKRIEEAFSLLQLEPREGPSLVANAMIQELHDRIGDLKGDDEGLDVAIAAGSLRLESHEVDRYEFAASLADHLGLGDISELFGRTRGEEEKVKSELQEQLDALVQRLPPK